MKGSVLSWRLLVAAISLTLISRSECNSYRLSKSVLPSFYNLTINVKEKEYGRLDYEFDGEVAITLQTNQSDIYEITLHKDYLYMSSCLLYNKDGALLQNVTKDSLKSNWRTSQLTVPLIEPLTPNENYTLYFKYSGYFGNHGTGLFSSFYGTNEDHTVYLIQLKGQYARSVFPCFDEPTFKAKFQLHLRRPSKYNAVSNTRLIRTTKEGNDSYVDHFDITPIMSTYLLAFVISEYQARGNLSEFAILSAPENYNYTEFSYNVGERVIAAYNELFQMPYKQLGNEVLLFATKPWTLNNNNMENWGLIIFKEDMLIHKPGYTDSLSHKELTIRMIAHEIAHMWFGNSVTLSWWSHFWLNEGFARFYEIFMTDQIYNNKYHMEEQFVVDNLQRILEKDAVATSLPLTSPEIAIQSSYEIDNETNFFPYDKGASIIRMWRSLMGSDNFNKSINSYLKQYHLKNTNPSDLFAHLKQNWPAQPEVDLDTFFSDFTEQVGYPMVIVNITQDNQKIILHQKRFLYDYEDGSDTTLRYTIPITFTTNLDQSYYNLTPYTYFKKNETTVEISFENPIEWIILNQKQSNYYRVFYDKPILTQIKQLFSTSRSRRIPATTKAQIIDDLFNFAYAGMIDYADVFEYLEYLRYEFDYVPWSAAYHGMERVVQRLTPQQLPYFEKYLSNITTGIFNELSAKSSSSDSVKENYNRVLHVSWLCKYQNTNCNKQVKLLFLGNLEKPSPDYREIFYCAVSRTDAHARLWDLYHNETDFDTKNLLSRAISCSRDYATYFKLELFHLLRYSEQFFGLITMYQQNPDLMDPIFSMITENIGELLSRWDQYDVFLILRDMVNYFTTREQEKQFTIFIDNNIHRFDNRTNTDIQLLPTTIRKNLEWAEQRLNKLVNYLAKRNEAVV
ncbi:aminopeptidase N-like [Drosophila sulfurigaster albostrigata]|uniref:aminopeptidase N-like n=1 Tax=Drosophila sulfurigaster albostrigata TaxID=89887 RepID=UPI002D21DE60|nr:aminopeptidase N-like [Drosophila sulfurigaster albostrigata]